MDVTRDEMISKVKGMGADPQLVDSKFMSNLQNPKKIHPQRPPAPQLNIKDKVDKFILSKSYKMKKKFIKNIKTKKSFLFNLIILILFTMALGGWLFYKWKTKNKYHTVIGAPIEEQYAEV